MKENFVKAIESGIKKNWNLPALSNYEEGSLSYEKVAGKICWMHYIFKKTGLKKGDKVAVIGKNSTNWALTYISTITYGAVIVPILPDFKPDDIHHIINHSDTVLFFAAESIFDTLDESKMPQLDAVFALENFRLLYHKKKDLVNKLENSERDYLKDYPQFSVDSISFPEVKNNQLAAIVYTSGTTGFSKGVMLPHNSLMGNIKYAQIHLPLKSGEKVLSFMPLAHSYGCAFEFLYPFCMGCHITFLGKIPSPKIIVKAFQDIRPHLVLSVPLIIEKIYKKQIKPALSKGPAKIMIKLPILKNVVLKKVYDKLVNAFGGNFYEVVIGGAALNKEVESFLTMIKFPFTVGYGMTEFGPLISYATWKTTRIGSVGQIVDDMEVKIDSSDPQRIVGEILVRGEHIMDGYYKNKQATEETIDKDGWLHTGDLGLLDKDNFIYIKGRSKNMILGPSGQNIYPEEIEAKLNNMPYVSESLVLEKNGQLVALIYPDMEMVDAEKLSESSLNNILEQNRKLLNSQLAAYLNISQFEVYPEEFEKTPTKKIKRFLYSK
ncbi:MAG TPA: AMP-binding protein [bacterium]|nr:AMP-binding protein [bacterium]HPN45019.1 AMP-binding protein [bacterium]